MKISERQKLNEKLRSPKGRSQFKNMRNHYSALLTIMKHDPDLHNEYDRVTNCGVHKPCLRSACTYCGGGKAKASPNKLPAPPSIDKPKSEKRRKSRGGKRNFKYASGQWLAKGFVDDDPHLHPFTINFHLMTATDDPKTVATDVRKKMRAALLKHMPESCVKIVLDIAPAHSDRTATDWPITDLAPEFHSAPRACELAFTFHGHGFIWHPTLTWSEIRDILKSVYPGRNRVSGGHKKPKSIDSDGFTTGGIEGYGEYAGKEKTSVDMDDSDPEQDNVAAVALMMKMRDKWPRQSRRLSFNTRTNQVKAATPQSTKETSPSHTLIETSELKPSFTFGDIIHDTNVDLLCDVVDSILDHLIGSIMDTMAPLAPHGRGGQGNNWSYLKAAVLIQFNMDDLHHENSYLRKSIRPLRPP